MALRLKLPTTMTGLIGVGCLLVAVPLLIASLLAQLALERIAKQTESIVEEALSLNRLTTTLGNGLDGLERTSRQYLVLQDPVMLEIAEVRWAEAARTLDGIEARAREPALKPSVQALREGFLAARASWQRGRGDPTAMIEAVERVHTLIPHAEQLLEQSGQHVDARLQALRHDSRSARHDMLLSALTLIPLAGLLGWACSVIITLPLKSLYRAIATLGRGRYTQPVAIRYPREMQRLGEQIDWLRCRLARLEADKERFLRQISHELKTPLSSLREGVSLLHEGSLGELTTAQREVAAILSESSVELESLIYNLLAYAEWNARKDSSSREWFEVMPLISEVLAQHTLAMSKRGLRAQLQVEAEHLYGRRDQLRVAIENLVSNAIKHAPDDSTIDIGTRSAQQQCLVTVRDHGRGVPMQRRDAIFEPFIRGGEPEEQGIRGTGIGLSIVREVMHAHEGSATVEDANPGAIFRLVWPCALL